MMASLRIAGVAALFMLVAGVVGRPACGEDAPSIVPVEGAPFSGVLKGIDDAWTLTFQTPTGPRQLAAGELLRWGTAPEVAAAPLIVLAGGGILSAEVRDLAGDQLIADSLLFGELRLPLASVRGVVFHPPAERLQRDRLLDRVAAATGSRDQLWLENGDRVEGLLAGAGRRTVQGPPAPQTVTHLEALRLQVEGGVAEIPLGRIVAAIFNPALVGAPPARGLRAWIGFADDGLVLVERVHTQHGLTTLTLPGGVLLRTDEVGFQQSVQFVQPLGGAVAYLSDLAPLGYRHLPYLTLAWDYQRDRNVLGGRLRVGGKTHLKGLGMHSTSRLAYRLDGAYRQLEADLALDESTGTAGSAVFRVYTMAGDDAWKPVYESPILRGGDAPLPISVDVTGAKAIALIVEHADRGDIQDHANWLEARLR